MKKEKRKNGIDEIYLIGEISATNFEITLFGLFYFIYFYFVFLLMYYSIH